MKLFGRLRNGFFIEAGAHDGVDISNTLYLEKQLGWTGILVEPNPDTFAGSFGFQSYRLTKSELRD